MAKTPSEGSAIRRDAASGRFLTSGGGALYRDLKLASGRHLRLLDDAVLDTAIARASSTARKIMARKSA